MNPARAALLSPVVALLLSGVPAATLAGPTIHWGQYATVQSDTDGNGLYTYSLTAGTDPLTFIAGQDHILELTFYGMQDIYDTPDWESSSPAADMICWTYTGADPLTPWPTKWSMPSPVAVLIYLYPGGERADEPALQSDALKRCR